MACNFTNIKGNWNQEDLHKDEIDQSNDLRGCGENL